MILRILLPALAGRRRITLNRDMAHRSAPNRMFDFASGPAVTWFPIGAAIAIPLIFNPWGYNAFAVPKSYLLRAIVLAMGLTIVLLGVRVSNPAGQPASARYARLAIWLALAFCVSLLLSTLFSVAPHTSLFGAYWRQDGLTTQVAYVMLFVLTSLTLRTQVQIVAVWRALVWGSAPVAGYALLQAAGLDPFTWQSDAAAAVFSTFGRSNFLGAYLVLVMPLTWARIPLERRRWPYLLLGALQLIVLALTGARAAWLGMLCASAVFAALWALTGARKRKALAGVLLAIVAAGILLVAVAVAGSSGATEPPPSPPSAAHLDRIASLGDLHSGSSAARLTIWRASLALVRERAWLGYGPETMQQVFERVYPPQLVYYQGRDVSVDRAHNLWLDLAVTAGIPGMLAFALLIGSIFAMGARALRSADDEWTRVASAALLAAVAGHLLNLQFSFDTIATATSFWLILALVVALARLQRHAVLDENHTPERRGHGRLAALLAFALAVSLCLRPVLADVYFARSLDSGLTQSRRIAGAQSAVRLWPFEAEYRAGLARAHMARGDFAAAERELFIARRFQPHSARHWVDLGDLYARWGEMDPRYREHAASAYSIATTLAPQVAANHVALGRYLSHQGSFTGGERALQRAIELDTTQVEAYRHLARLYAAQMRTAEAETAHRAASLWEMRTAAP